MPRHLLHIIIILFLIGGLMNANPSDSPKIGLVLSGGGAKGFAHIGILKMIDSLDIPIDYIAGTSIGGIVGALYAIGYSGYEIERLALRTEWDALFSNKPDRAILPYLLKKKDGKYRLTFGLKEYTPQAPSGLISGQKISLMAANLTLNAEYIRDFDNFYIPFRCVCADLISGEEVVLKKGSLAKAMRATMSIPTVFSPVEWGDSLLIDGGAINNLPVDVVREMGAGFIIAVNVMSPKRNRENLTNMIDILDETFNIPLYPRIEKNIEASDIYIAPDIKYFGASDFENKKVRQLLKVGEEAAREHKQQLINLKDRYNLIRSGDLKDNMPLDKNPVIYGISITGNITMSYIDVYKSLDIKPGDRFDPKSFTDKMTELRTSGFFQSVNYQVRPVGQDTIRLLINIKEQQKPIIYGVHIDGNQKLPFRFIYNYLGLKPNEPLDIKLLNSRINELYSLGYFETITYEIEPVSDNRIRLKFKVKERPFNQLHVGFHYDDFYDLVGHVGLEAINLLLPGLRLDASLKFAGLLDFKTDIAYPSRQLNLPVFPYLRLHYKDRPVAIYGTKGNKVASYKDRSAAVGLGLTILLEKSAAVEVELNSEKMNINPDIALDDPDEFPSWYDHLHKVQINFNLDVIDDVLLPRNGFDLNAYYETSLKQLGSELDYRKFNISYNQFVNPFRKHTLRFYGYYIWGSNSLPVYKYALIGGPDTFVGLDYQQFLSSRLAVGRIDYRFEYKKDIFLKLIFNLGNYRLKLPPEYKTARLIWGYGIGVKFLSILGPFELIYARGHRSFYEPLKMRNIFYFQAGFNL